MKKRVSTRQVIDGLEVALAKHRHMERELKSYNNRDNPHVEKSIIKVEAMADAFQAALEALQGEPRLLNIYKS